MASATSWTRPAVSTTSAPSSTKRRATAWPMPAPAAAVTMATRPSRMPMSVLLRGVDARRPRVAREVGLASLQESVLALVGLAALEKAGSELVHPVGARLLAQGGVEGAGRRL